MAVKIGLNQSIMSSRANCDAYFGLKMANFQKALREAQDAAAMLAQYAQSDLTSLGYGDGTNGTSNEGGYLLSAFSDLTDLAGVVNGTPSQRSSGYNYMNSFRYVASAG